MICELSGDGGDKALQWGCPLPCLHPGQSQARLPMHTLELELSAGYDLIIPESGAVSNPDSSL